MDTVRVQALRMMAWLGAATTLGCSGGSESPKGQASDPVYSEVQALQGIANKVEADLNGGGTGLLALAEVLEKQMSQEDISVIMRTYLAMMEAYRNGEPWQPTEDFYGVVDRLRNLPFFSEMPVRQVPRSKGALMGSRKSALFLANATPSCGLSCEAQGVLYGLLDYGVGEVKDYYVGLLTSGVDCMQDAAKMGKCAAENTCKWEDFVLFLGGCGALTANVALEVSGASKVKAAYGFLKQVLGIWSVGSLTASVADFVASCKDFQEQHCQGEGCRPGERLCLATNGAGSKCCPSGQTCSDCLSCTITCGLSCCVVGQRCEEGECVTCASACGPTCCTAKEVCGNPETGLCAACDNPCGLSCCGAEMTCIESLQMCCPTEDACGGDCCDAGETCVGAPPRCCSTPCGETCCEAGQVCDPGTLTCKEQQGCEASGTLDCEGLCKQALAQVEAQCVSMGGKVVTTEIEGCVSACKCIIAEVPEVLVCLSNPLCPGCDKMQEPLTAAVGKCGQPEAKVYCEVPEE